MRDVLKNGGLENIGISILTWRSPKTLASTLKNLKRVLPINQFGDAFVFAQELNHEDKKVANENGFRIEGNSKNIGIMGGMKEAILRSRMEIILYLECDCLILEDSSTSSNLVSLSAQCLRSKRLDVMNLRHLRNPGKDFDLSKFKNYWPLENDSFLERSIKFFKRMIRPTKANKLIGHSCLVHDRADKYFPNDITLDCCFYELSSKNLNWTNQSIMVRKNWMLDTIFPFAESNSTSRRDNGFPNLERELNCSWWRRQKFRIGWANPGLFTHQRLDRPEGDDKAFQE